MTKPLPSKAAALLSAKAVRAASEQLYALAEAGRLHHFTLHADKLAAAAEHVVATTIASYPDLAIPFHARWRHFAAAGKDRWGAFETEQDWASKTEQARAAFDLAIVSVLLDAGAGPDWRYIEPDGTVTTRSEGLGVASFAMFAAGAFAQDGRLRADASRLSGLGADDLAKGFQCSAENPLVGLEGRAALLNALGRTVMGNPAVFARSGDPRPGGLFDHLAAQADSGRLPATAILDALLQHLGPIWPGRLTLEGVSLGDAWTYQLPDGAAIIVPFHKLSQWLAYSLIEPLQAAGIQITDIDGLTGLPEYRNGGLFLDAGVITLKDMADAARAHAPGSALVVEWRALTVALLDRIAPLVRKRLGRDASSLPLAKVLEGGTWASGRRIAREKRADGGPPLAIISDGTVF
jgi:Protein of unknown function (DUF1688)